MNAIGKIADADHLGGRHISLHLQSGRARVEYQDDLPFGGVGASGIGAYHGVEGFRRLSHAKGIYEQGRWNTVKLLRPPYGKLTERILSVLLR
jgi:hypothetical protein